MAAHTGSTPEEASSELVIAVKNPSRPNLGPFVLKVPRNASVLVVKQKLATEYYGNPEPSRQTLIYGGKVLKADSEALSSILNTADDQPVHTLHLVVKGEVKPAASSSLGTGASLAQPQASTQGRTAISEASSSSRQPVPQQAADTARRPAMVPQGPPQSQSTSQAGYAGVWPSSQPDPTILAAYNAALESLRSRPAFPSLPPEPSPSGMANAGPTTASLPQPTAAPSVIHPSAAGLPGASSGEGQASGSPSQGSRDQPASSSQLPGSSQASRQPQLYAPTLAYVPVSLVQGAQPQESAQGNASEAATWQPNVHQQAQPMLPYPHFGGPLMPMMMPQYFNPYPAQLMQGPPLPPGGPALQPQQMQNPAAPPRAHPGAPAAAQEAGNGAAAMQPGPRLGRPGMPPVRIRLIRINVKLLFQMAIMGFFIYQSMPRGRFFRILGMAVAIYFLWPLLNRDNAVGRAMDRFANSFRPLRAPGVPGGDPAGLQEGQAGARRERAFLREVQALFVGFFASLLPGFNMNAEDAAAFAAAQQVVGQNEGREHID